MSRSFLSIVRSVDQSVKERVPESLDLEPKADDLEFVRSQELGSC